MQDFQNKTIKTTMFGEKWVCEKRTVRLICNPYGRRYIVNGEILHCVEHPNGDLIGNHILYPYRESQRKTRLF